MADSPMMSSNPPPPATAETTTSRIPPPPVDEDETSDEQKRVMMEASTWMKPLDAQEQLVKMATFSNCLKKATELMDAMDAKVKLIPCYVCETKTATRCKEWPGTAFCEDCQKANFILCWHCKQTRMVRPDKSSYVWCSEHGTRCRHRQSDIQLLADNMDGFTPSCAHQEPYLATPLGASSGFMKLVIIDSK